MAGTPARRVRKDLQAYLRDNVSEEFVLAWQKLRDENDGLTNIRTLWTRAYFQHCANVYDEEQRAIRVDQAQDSKKHVRGLWRTLGIMNKTSRSKIRATGKMFKSLPASHRDLIIERIPATKDALYVAATYDSSELQRVLTSQAIGPESTTARFRELLDKATPQDRARNATLTKVPASKPAIPSVLKTKGPHRVTVLCRTRKAVVALLAFAKADTIAYAIEDSQSVTDG